MQKFLEYESPTEPSSPPLTVHEAYSTCEIRLAASDSTVTDYFSYAQVRLLAIDIIGVCAEQGGFGGFAPVGSEIGWTVTVIGVVW